MIHRMYMCGECGPVPTAFPTTHDVITSGHVVFGREPAPLPFRSRVDRVKMLSFQNGVPIEYWILAPEYEGPVCPVLAKPLMDDYQCTTGAVSTSILNSVLGQPYYHPVTQLITRDLPNISEEYSCNMELYTRDDLWRGILYQQQAGLAPFHYVLTEFPRHEPDGASSMYTADIETYLQILDSAVYAAASRTDLFSWLTADVDYQIDPLFKALFCSCFARVNDMYPFLSPDCQVENVETPGELVFNDPYGLFTEPGCATEYNLFINTLGCCAAMLPFDTFEITLWTQEGILEGSCDNYLYRTMHVPVSEEPQVKNILTHILTEMWPRLMDSSSIYQIHLMKTEDEYFRIMIEGTSEEMPLLDVSLDLFAMAVYGPSHVLLQERPPLVQD